MGVKVVGRMGWGEGVGVEMEWEVKLVVVDGEDVEVVEEVEDAE